MPPQITLRLDDACPTMAQGPWQRLETAVDGLDIKPIVGVIPACRDAQLSLCDPDPQFWERVRAWQAKGWTIALHGLHHVYHDDPPGKRALVQFHRRGEFVGLDLETQRTILREAWSIFREHGVAPTMFMAPAHSFDAVTLGALSLETPIRWITDGISYRPFKHLGLHWLPQQLGQFPAWLPKGTWTLCIHPNTMSLDAVDALVVKLGKYRSRFVALDEPRVAPTQRGILDDTFAVLYWGARLLKRPWGSFSRYEAHARRRSRQSTR